MEEEKAIVNKEEYDRIIPRIGYYMKSKNIATIIKHKSLLFAASDEERIYLFSNSLEEMGSLHGHKKGINCLCALPNNILASGSDEMSIKIWETEERRLISTLYGHTDCVYAVCYVREGVIVSGGSSDDIIIWSISPESTIYSLKLILTDHKDEIIQGIIRLNSTDIIAAYCRGDLRIWNIDGGECIRYIPNVGDTLIPQMMFHMGNVVINQFYTVYVWGAANNWDSPIKLFSDLGCGFSFEFLSDDLLLRGGEEGGLEFIDYSQTGRELPMTTIRWPHSKGIDVIQRIAKNIVITASDDGYLKVINPISRHCYMKLKKYLTEIANFY